VLTGTLAHQNRELRGKGMELLKEIYKRVEDDE